MELLRPVNCPIDAECKEVNTKRFHEKKKEKQIMMTTMMMMMILSFLIDNAHSKPVRGGLGSESFSASLRLTKRG
jgi:accessory gene regulator protein AgrB